MAMTSVDFTDAHWRKSSRSGGGNNGNCVTVAWSQDRDHVGYRDSKAPGQATLVLSAEAHEQFLAWINHGELS